jgi:hypothetical protein
MSTLKSVNLQHPSSASPNIVLDSSGNATLAGTMAMATPFAMRNRVINGAMEIDQRNAGAAITTNGALPVDRFIASINTTGATFSSQRSTTAPSGFINSLAFTVGTGASSSAAEVCGIQQRIEGLNVIDFAFGTASALTVTLSFWVRSSMTGTFSGSVANSAQDRSYVFTYSISASNTWEYKTISISGDTSGTWLRDNGVGVRIWWDLGSGTNYNGTAGTWSAANYRNSSGSANFVGTSGATFYLTGVQLEVGSVATPFERRLYTTELQLAQRYYQKASGNQYSSYGATYNYVQWYFKVTMRASPTLTGATGTSGSLTADFASVWTSGSAYASFSDATATAEL